MNITTSGVPRLVEKRSDERDTVALVNSMRDVLNARAEYIYTLTTTDATPANIWVDNMPASSITDLFARVVMHDTTSGQGAVYWKRAAVISDANSLLSLTTYTVSPDYESVYAVAADCAFAATATPGNISLLVTGLAARTCNWRAWITVMAYPW
jgi:hypothetical protein